MVSLLIKKHDFAVFLTKTHHLKTLYIMAEKMRMRIKRNIFALVVRFCRIYFYAYRFLVSNIFMKYIFNLIPEY